MFLPSFSTPIAILPRLFLTLHFYPYCSNTRAPFTPICNSVTCIWVKKLWEIRKDLQKDKCAPYPYLFNCLSPTIQTRLGENLAEAAAAQASGRAACARPGGAACARGRRVRGRAVSARGRRMRVSGAARARGRSGGGAATGVQLPGCAGKQAAPWSQRSTGVQQPWSWSAGMRFRPNVGRM